MPRSLLQLIFNEDFDPHSDEPYIVVSGTGSEPNIGWAALVPVEGDYGHGAYRFTLCKRLPLGEKVTIRFPVAGVMVDRECEIAVCSELRGGGRYTAFEIKEREVVGAGARGIEEVVTISEAPPAYEEESEPALAA